MRSELQKINQLPLFIFIRLNDLERIWMSLFGHSDKNGLEIFQIMLTLTICLVESAKKSTTRIIVK